MKLLSSLAQLDLANTVEPHPADTRLGGHTLKRTLF